MISNSRIINKIIIYRIEELKFYRRKNFEFIEITFVFILKQTLFNVFSFVKIIFTFDINLITKVVFNIKIFKNINVKIDD